MNENYLKGYNDALNSIYNNPYKKLCIVFNRENAYKFMQYHNGHNQGSNDLKNAIKSN